MLLCYSTLKFYWFDLLQNGRGINGRYTDHQHILKMSFISVTRIVDNAGFSCIHIRIFSTVLHIYVVYVLLGRNGASNDFSGTFVC
jgi:hypothetical protein